MLSSAKLDTTCSVGPNGSRCTFRLCSALPVSKPGRFCRLGGAKSTTLLLAVSSQQLLLRCPSGALLTLALRFCCCTFLLHVRITVRLAADIPCLLACRNSGIDQEGKATHRAFLLCLLQAATPCAAAFSRLPERIALAICCMLQVACYFLACCCLRFDQVRIPLGLQAVVVSCAASCDVFLCFEMPTGCLAAD